MLSGGFQLVHHQEVPFKANRASLGSKFGFLLVARRSSLATHDLLIRFGHRRRIAQFGIPFPIASGSNQK
jgi:hypothetical protein